MTTKGPYFVGNPGRPELIDSHTGPVKPIAEEIETIKSRMSFIRSANNVSSSVEKTLKSMSEKLMLLGVPEHEVNNIYRP